MGRSRRSRRQRRAQEFGAKFGARHPRLTLVLVCVLLVGVVAVYGYQLSYGAYLGPGWAIAAVAGVAAAVWLGAAILVSHRRHADVLGRPFTIWMVLALVSASAIKFPFPRGRYGGVQAFFNVAHAAMLGFETVTCTAIAGLLAYLFVRSRGRARRQRRVSGPPEG